MVKNRAPGQAGGVLQPAHRGALVAEPGETVAGRGEDLLAARVQLVLAYSGHASIVARAAADLQSVRTSCQNAGIPWARRDPDGGMMWPRTDPAMIVLVHDG